MCECCDDYNDPPVYAEDAFPIEEVIRTARLIEVDLPGMPVDESMWAIYFGSKGGCLDARSFERIERAKTAALKELAAPRQRPMLTARLRAFINA